MNMKFVEAHFGTWAQPLSALWLISKKKMINCTPSLKNCSKFENCAKMYYGWKYVKISSPTIVQHYWNCVFNFNLGVFIVLSRGIGFSSASTTAISTAFCWKFGRGNGFMHSVQLALVGQTSSLFFVLKIIIIRNSVCQTSCRYYERY